MPERTISELEWRTLHAAADEAVRLRHALKSIAANTCCDKCQEAALVAKAALREPGQDLGVKLCPHCEGAGTFDDRASGGEIECSWCDGTGDAR